MAPGGGFVVAWSSRNQDGNQWGVYAQRYDAAGSPLGSEFRVNTTTKHDQQDPRVAIDPSGNFAVTWSSDRQDAGGTWGVYAQHYDAAGVPRRGDAGQPDDAGRPALFRRGPGRLRPARRRLVERGARQDGSGYGVYGRTFQTSGGSTSPGFIVSPVSGLVTTEAGGAASFTVSLASGSTANVTVPLGDTNTAEGTVSAGSLTFTPANWNTPQTVTVTGVNDFVADGDQAYTVVTGPAASSDAKYQGLKPADVALINRDDDAVGVVVTPGAGGVTVGQDGTATFIVVLASQPTGSVTINLSSSDATAGGPSKPQLAFDGSNWDRPQTVTVTAGRPGVDFTVVTSPARSNDPGYAGYNAIDVSVTVLLPPVASVPPVPPPAPAPTPPPIVVPPVSPPSRAGRRCPRPRRRFRSSHRRHHPWWAGPPSPRSCNLPWEGIRPRSVPHRPIRSRGLGLRLWW